MYYNLNSSVVLLKNAQCRWYELEVYNVIHGKYKPKLPNLGWRRLSEKLKGREKHVLSCGVDICPFDSLNRTTYVLIILLSFARSEPRGK